MSTVAQPSWHTPAGGGGDGRGRRGAEDRGSARRPSAAEAKHELRRRVRTQRGHRSPRLRDQVAERLAAVVLTIPEVAHASCVSVYASRPGEPGTGPVIEALAGRGVRLLLPVLGTGLQRDWAEYDGAHDLRERAPGRPPEPGTPPLGADAVRDADVVLVPALAVDAAGTRLGQGGGWYDRVLAHVRPGVPVVALVHADEVLGVPLPREPHDRPVSAVATPERWWRVGAADG
ncbi:5-formyltetrahydrofolate cyclo-ligase [Cellulomonas shaoxiangyii]|uniref:5-formyltetrahydrofolate cyclo-ligase n=1 Tax=Cellulomonas shaoxiangyii TaxID=2566013 RepID=A0A4P7SJY0_9CELL|nr:5-formyltetrahydrofolate cyclo-ligase [Cellulomonas shaoxiangyii]QCB94472.1 5-formyltetrahydrofolate cyclo-ligase [Cellulomonas shaoxiangyii]TGY86054.1 5-formyltetrahydrofolate cyclo-ligase [Cellulomonas shaoxiangyii]